MNTYVFIYFLRDTKILFMGDSKVLYILFINNKKTLFLLLQDKSFYNFTMVFLCTEKNYQKTKKKQSNLFYTHVLQNVI